MNEIDKIKQALLIAYIGDVGCTLSNADCNDLTKYIAKVEAELEKTYKFVEAFGLLTTLSPKMEIDCNNPIAMAQRIEREARLAQQKIEAASDLLEAISLWFYKRQGMEDPNWTEQYKSVCRLFEQEDEQP